MKSKRIVFICIVFAAVLSVASVAHAEEIDLGIEIGRQIGELQTGKWDKELNSLPDEVADIFGGKSFSTIIQEFATGGGTVDEKTLFTSLFSVAQKELSEKLRLVVVLLAMAVVGGIASQLRGSFSSGTGDAAGFVLYIMTILIVVYTFADTVAQAKRAVDAAARIMEIAFPPMLALLAASGGGVASAGMFQPATALLSGATTALLGKVALPMTLAMGIVAVVGNLSKRMPLTRMQTLLKTVLKWLLGILSTLFIGFGAIRGIMAKGMDGVSLRARPLRAR